VVACEVVLKIKGGAVTMEQTKTFEYDTQRGIIVSIPADGKGDPRCQVEIRSEAGGSIHLALKDVRHLVQALEWALEDERKST
jgi:hypothetical protein